MILIGTWRVSPVSAIFVGLGIILGVTYIWRAMQKAFFAETDAQTHTSALPPITTPEKLGAGLLIASSLAIGLYPQAFFRYIIPALNSPLFESLKNGGWK
jgi:NADH-quinone oxidoreductase subunit M